MFITVSVLWYLLIFASAIPAYHRVQSAIEKGNSTALSFLKQAMEFIGVASFLWIGIAGSLVVLRPEVDVRFLPDLIVLGSCSLLLSWITAPELRDFLSPKEVRGELH